MSIIALVMMVVVGGIFAISGGGATDDGFTEVINLAPDTAVNDEEGLDYENRDLDRIIDDPTITVFMDNTSGKIEVEYDAFDSDLIVLKNMLDNTTMNYSVAELTKYTGALKDGETIKKIWFNTAFDLGGFDKYFQAVLVYNADWNTYKVLWSIENRDYVIPNLESIDVVNTFTDYQFSSYLTANNYKLFASTSDISSPLAYNSIVLMDANGDIEILKDFAQGFTVISAYTEYSWYKYHYVGATGYDLEQESWAAIRDMNVVSRFSPRTNMQFAINEFTEYSFPSLAVNQDTRTTGFNEISIVKQELTAGQSSMLDSNFKLVSNENYNDMLAYTENQNLLSSLVETNAQDVVDGIGADSSISMWSDTINHIAYGIGLAASEDHDNIEGIVIDGYISNVDGAEFIEVGHFNFDASESYGLRLGDTGASTISADNLAVGTFGKMSMDSVNDSISFVGTAYPIGIDAWATFYAYVLNVFDYSFDYGASITGSVVNGKLDTTDVIDTCDITTGCEYAFTSAYQNPGIDTLTLTTQKPLQDLLVYNTENYWMLYTMKTPSYNVDGCMIFDYRDVTLDIRMPVSVCGSQLAGASSDAQFKIFGR